MRRRRGNAFPALLCYTGEMTDKLALLKRITIEPGKMGGKPCIRGMRIRVTDVLELLASDMTREEILMDYPYLEPEDFDASLLYAADLSNDRQVIAAE